MNIFLPVLAVLFVWLKLTGVIGWSWWLVLIPLWLAPAFLIAVFVLCLLVGTKPRFTFKRKSK